MKSFRELHENPLQPKLEKCVKNSIRAINCRSLRLEHNISLAAEILVSLIPIVGIVCGAAVVFFALLWRHRETKLKIMNNSYEPMKFNFPADRAFPYVRGLGSFSDVLCDSRSFMGCIGRSGTVGIGCFPAYLL